MLQQTNGYSSGRSDHLLTLKGALRSITNVPRGGGKYIE